MSQIIYVQPIFGAGKKQTELNVNSLLSFAEYMKSYGMDTIKLDVLLGGWCLNEKYWLDIMDAANQIPACCNVTLKKFDRNYGKSFVVNNLLQKYLPAHPETTYIMSCDSDMVFMGSEEKLFERAAIACRAAAEARKIKTGFIAFNQAEDNCHWVNTFDCKLPYRINEWNQNENIAWPSNGCGIAGGALFITREAWDAVGGYHQYPNFYGSDDGLLLREIQQAGFSAQVLLTASIKHPKQDDKDYIALKKEAMVDPFEAFTKEKYEERISKAEQFWKDRDAI